MLVCLKRLDTISVNCMQWKTSLSLTNQYTDDQRQSVSRAHHIKTYSDPDRAWATLRNQPLYQNWQSSLPIPATVPPTTSTARRAKPMTWPTGPRSSQMSWLQQARACMVQCRLPSWQSDNDQLLSSQLHISRLRSQHCIWCDLLHSDWHWPISSSSSTHCWVTGSTVRMSFNNANST